MSTENFDLTPVCTVSQLTVSMDIFCGLRDRYGASWELFAGRAIKKEINRFEAENLKDIEWNGSICSRRKVEKYEKRRARRRPDPQRFSACSLVRAKR